MTISRVRSQRTAARPATAAAKKPTAGAPGYPGKSSFDAVKAPGQVSLRRATSSALKDIKQGLRSANDAAVRIGVGTAAAGLGLKLPDLSRKTGWESFGALGTALGHTMKDAFHPNPADYRDVRKRALALTRPINDPDPSNGRVV